MLLAAVFVTALVTALEGTTFAVALALDAASVFAFAVPREPMMSSARRYDSVPIGTEKE